MGGPWCVHGEGCSIWVVHGVPHGEGNSIYGWSMVKIILYGQPIEQVLISGLDLNLANEMPHQQPNQDSLYAEWVI